MDEAYLPHSLCRSRSEIPSSCRSSAAAKHLHTHNPSISTPRHTRAGEPYADEQSNGSPRSGEIKGSGVFRISVYLPNGDFKSELDLKSEPGPVTA